MARAEREAITGVWGRATSGVQGQSPWSGGQGSKAPLKLRAFSWMYAPRFRQISPFLMFGVKRRKMIFKHRQTTNIRAVMLSLTWMLWRSVNCRVGLYSTCWHELLSFNNTPFDDS